MQTQTHGIDIRQKPENKNNFSINFQGDYFPAIATFKNAKVKLNFGPRFKFSPPKNLKVRPMCERAEEVVIEQSLSDMKFFTENEGKLGLNNYLMSP